jgi:hypothetical protein
MILQGLARSRVSKIKQDDLASTCKINGKQDKARDLVRSSKIKQDWARFSKIDLFKIKKDQARLGNHLRSTKINQDQSRLSKIKQDWYFLRLSTIEQD